MKKLLPLLCISMILYWSCEEEVDTTPPTVSILLEAGQSVNEIVTIVVETNDNEGISKVEFFIGESLVLTDTESPFEYQWNTTQYDDGSEWKEWAIKNRINQVESIIEETGREAYRLFVLGDQGHFIELNRHKLYPVMTIGN